jgi:hypothetical protein
MNRRRHRLRQRLVRMMVLHQRRQRASIRADDPVLAPHLHHHIPQHRILNHRSPVPRVIGRHKRICMTIFNRHPKRHRVVLLKQALIKIRRARRPQILIAVGQKMLQQRRRHPVLSIALQPARIRRRQRPHQKWIFPVRLFTSPPTRIATQVRIRRAHHQPAAVVLPKRIPSLICLLRRSLLQQRRIPRLPQPS